ncbi:MAG: alkaline phosphatase family protein, partial [Mycobacteriales bacterium]
MRGPAVAGRRLAGALAAVVVAAACSTGPHPGPAPTAGPASNSTPGAAPGGIHRIQHVIVIFMENRSFDSYFGTFPGADGIPMKGG